MSPSRARGAVGLLLGSTLGLTGCGGHSEFPTGPKTVRVSVKVVLDAEGRRSTSGFYHQDAQIVQAIDDANTSLDPIGAVGHRDLVEIVAMSRHSGIAPTEAVLAACQLEIVAGAMDAISGRRRFVIE